jgi:hypothetical protein
MKVWYSTDHDSFYPVGCAIVVLAEDKRKARSLLKKELKRIGLNEKKPFTLCELKEEDGAVVLIDGNY